ncbi:MAG TPA: serine/threonine-protein kinase, partial [Pirellulaceae bacterium]
MKLSLYPSAGAPEVPMREAADISEPNGAARLPAASLADTHAHGESDRGYTQRFTLPSGSRPLEGYTIKRGVGVGGFGEVYYATTDAGKDVALKKIQRNLDIELRGVRQCLNIKHVNLLSLYDIRYDDEGQAWVVMEFVAGCNLQSLIERHPEGLTLGEARFWWEGIAAGVGHLHDCGIVHRDLKPGNIFLDGTTVKIGDYGLSKFISCSRRSGQTQSVGTFHYMAPEIGQGRYGKEIDIYALGIILYEMLTGRVPFDGESSQEIIMKHLTAEPPVQDLPSPFREVVTKALAKDPETRFRSVGEMRGALSWDV